MISRVGLDGLLQLCSLVIMLLPCPHIQVALAVLEEKDLLGKWARMMLMMAETMGKTAADLALSLSCESLFRARRSLSPEL